MIYQWYPGHMTKAKRQMQADIKLVDAVVELVDARIPLSSKNPDIDTLAQGKARVIVLNKCDLADERTNRLFKAYYEKLGYFVCLVNAKTGNSAKTVESIMPKACKEKIERDKSKGMIARPVRAMIVGIPNVGKSTLINAIAGKSCTKTGNKPGVTKGKQWIRFGKSVELLDTPGILWPKFEDQSVGLKIAMIGSINEDLLIPLELSHRLLEYICKNYPGMIAAKYQVEETENPEEMLERIAIRRACRKKGNELDLDKMAGFIIDDFRGGRIGRISLEQPPVKEQG